MKTRQTFVRLRVILPWLLLAFVVHGDSSATDVYVSVDGHAQADGSIEKPYGSVPDAVRALRAAGNSDPAVIYLREGRHQLEGVNDIINNFIVAPVAVPRWGYLSFEWVPVTGSKIHRNIIISHPEGGNAHAARPRGGGRTGTGGPKLEQTDMDSNLYFHPTDSHWMDEHLSKMRAIGKEKASLFGDPLFTDAAGGDFSFRPGSPALKLGIEPLDVSKMGLKEELGEGNSAAFRDN